MIKAKRIATSTDPGFDPPRIDPEFLAYLPIQSEKDDAELTMQLMRQGCRERVVVWDEENIIVDGHRRSRICTANGIPYQVEYMHFRDRADVLLWMSENQVFGKRNLLDNERSYHIGKIMEAAERAHRGDGDTAEKVAKKMKVSRRKVQKDHKFAKAVDAHEKAAPGTRQKILAGGVSKTKVLKTAPIYCERHTRTGPPPRDDCPACADARKKKGAKKHTPKDLFDTPERRKPKPVPERLNDIEELKAMFTKLSGMATALLKKTGPHGEVIEEIERIRDYWSWCGLLEYTKDKATGHMVPRFIPHDGVVKTLTMAQHKGPKLKEPAVLEEYKKACGAVVWVPPATKFRRERRGE